MRSIHPLPTLMVLLIALGCPGGRADPGMIELSAPNFSIPACDAFTLTVHLAGRTDSTEADGYNFRILYDPARFAVVAGSASLRDAAGPGQNWLRYPAQENVGGPLLSDFTAFDPGVIHVSVVDLRLAPDPLDPRGTAAAAGFLYQVDFTALTPGASTISLAAAVDDAFLHDPFLGSLGGPSLAGASATLTVTGVRLQIQRDGPDQVTITWPKGILESTDNLSLPWKPVSDATNSLTVPAAGQQFYRAVLP